MPFLTTTLIDKLVVFMSCKGPFMYYIINKGGNVAKMDLTFEIWDFFVS